MAGVTEMEEDECTDFHQMGLDDRILEAIARLRWKEPTTIQQKAIPYFLEGTDLTVEARTGSGKTGAYVIPIIHKILEKKVTQKQQAIKALILAPSKELCRQIIDNVKALTVCCGREVRCVNLSEQTALEAQKPLLQDKPDILIGTPLRVLGHINAGHLNLKPSLEYLVIDEADLIFQFDNRKEVEEITKHLPKIYQAFFTSATMTSDVKKLKKLILHNPIKLRLEEPALPSNTQLSQYVMFLEEFDKALLIYTLLRINMLQGKTIIFVNYVDKAYKLHLFLNQFGIATCVLNSEKPAESRCHIVDRFNKGAYEIIIATDEKGTQIKQEQEKDAVAFTKTKALNEEAHSSKSKRKKDKESGVARGIDFQFVANVVNFDFPFTIQSYIHRVGRTARGNNSGIALSLVSKEELKTYRNLSQELTETMQCEKNAFKEFKFDFDQADGFRYRAKDAWRRCTSILIKETRKNDIMNEIFNATKLKTHFQENPQDLQVLRNNKHTKGLSNMPHLLNVQEYMLSDNLKRVVKKKEKVNKMVKKGGKQFKKDSSGLTKGQKSYLKKKNDPLKSMKFAGFK